MSVVEYPGQFALLETDITLVNYLSCPFLLTIHDIKGSSLYGTGLDFACSESHRNRPFSRLLADEPANCQLFQWPVQLHTPYVVYNNAMCNKSIINPFPRIRRIIFIHPSRQQISITTSHSLASSSSPAARPGRPRHPPRLRGSRRSRTCGGSSR